jgi:hypothetical protein
MINPFSKIKKQEGFVILFTILISAIILMIGAGIFSIATRETVLSSTAREAQAAFYAADAGTECALFLEGTGVFGSAQGIGINNGGSGTVQTTCGSTTPVVVGGGNGDPFTFKMAIQNTITNTTTCASVTVIDVTNISGGSGGPGRRVISQGYNVCNPATSSPDTTNPILVERDLDTTYGVGSAPAGGNGNGGGTPPGGQLPNNGGSPLPVNTNSLPQFNGQISPGVGAHAIQSNSLPSLPSGH